MPIQTGGFNFNPAIEQAVRPQAGAGGAVRQPLQFISGASLLPGENGIGAWLEGELRRQKEFKNGLADLGVAVGSGFQAKRENELEQTRYDEKKALENARFEFEKEKFYEGQKPEPLSALDEARLRNIDAETAALNRPDPFASLISGADNPDLPKDFEQEKPLSLLSATAVQAKAPAMLEGKENVALSLNNVRIPQINGDNALSETPVRISPEARLTQGPRVSPEAPKEATQEKVKVENLGAGVFQMMLPGGRKLYVTPDPKSSTGWKPIPGMSEKEPESGLSQEDRKAARDLRKEFVTESKNYISVRDSFRNIKSAAKTPSAAGDMSMVFAYMKMLDPTSTVREGEYANAQNAAGVPDRVVAAYNKVLNGQLLAKPQREDFLSQAKNLYDNQTKSHDQRVKFFTEQATREGLDPQQVVIPLTDEKQDSINELAQQLDGMSKSDPEYPELRAKLKALMQQN